MLNLARRITTQAMKMKAKSHDHPSRLRTAKYMIVAGATPKLMASTSESSSTPKRLPVFVMRATRPSSASITPPSTTHHPAHMYSPRAAETIANTPKKRLPSVNPFGSSTTARFMSGRGMAGVTAAAPRAR